jgi:hypothetical protein
MPRRKRPPDRRNQPPRDHALGVMTVVALIVTLLLLYESWTYYVFRHPLGGNEHAVDPVELVARKTGA